MKKCSKCNLEKKLEEFHIDRRNSTGRASRCKDCARAASKQWYEKSERYRDIIRDSGLKHRYGIDSETYWDLFRAQDGLCAICLSKPESKYFHVDHNHLTGAIRGLLCKTCNHGLGNFKDNPSFLQNAIDYLDRNSPGFLEGVVHCAREGGVTPTT